MAYLVCGRVKSGLLEKLPAWRVKSEWKGLRYTVYMYTLRRNALVSHSVGVHGPGILLMIKAERSDTLV